MSIEKSFGESKLIGEVTDEAYEDRGVTANCTRQIVEWTPPARYCQHLYEGFKIRLTQFVGSDGVRRFMPTEGDWRTLSIQCFIAGLAIRQELGALPEQVRTNVRIQFYALHWIKMRQEYLNRRFQYGRDVHVRVNSRQDIAGRNVMGQLSGLHDSLQHVNEIRKQSIGEELKPSQQFHDGLYRIASKILHLELTEKQTDELLRNSIMAHKKTLPVLSNDEQEEVNERLFTLMDKHFGRSATDFRRWITSAETNLETLIARKHGKVLIDREKAKSGMFALGWLGLKQSSICINATMRTVFNSIKNLNEAETRIFESLYFSQPLLNGFVVMQFLDRHDFLRPALVDIWNGKPVSEVIPAIRLLLLFYGEMAGNRRKADRLGYERRGDHCMSGSIGSVTSHIEEISPKPKSVAAQMIQTSLTDSLNLQCKTCQSDKLILENFFDGDPIQIIFMCENCKAETEFFYTRVELLEKLDPDDFKS